MPEGRIAHTLETNGYHARPDDIADLLLRAVEDGDLPEELECREVIVFILANREAMIRALSDVEPCIFDSNKGNPLQPSSALHTQLSGYSEYIEADDGEGDALEAETEAAHTRILAILAAAANMPVEKPVTLASASQKTFLPPSPPKHVRKKR